MAWSVSPHFQSLPAGSEPFRSATTNPSLPTWEGRGCCYPSQPCAGSIESDHNRSQVLRAALQLRGLSDSDLADIVAAAGSIESDHQLADLVMELALAEPTGGATCNPLACADPLPDPVGETFTVDVQADSDLVFAWPVAAGAAGYRIWQAIGPQRASEDLVAATADTGFVQPGGRFEGPSLYYVVRAVNACEWEGP